jgi:predicted outer membrane repeat protein
MSSLLRFRPAACSAVLLALFLLVSGAPDAFGQQIDAVEPATAYAGHPVVLSGSDLGGATGVTFNGTSVDFAVASNSTIRARVPEGATADGSFTVTTSGGSATSPTVALARGPYGAGRSMYFGANHVALPDESAFDFDPISDSGASFTVSFWMRIGANNFPPSRAGLVTKGSDAWRVQLANDRQRIEFALTERGETTAITSLTNTWDNHWHHVAAVFDEDARAMRLYVDGILEAETTLFGFEQNDSPVWIGGRYQDDARNFWGRLDQVRIYETAVTQQQIRNRAHRTVAAATPGLIAAYRFDASTPGTAFDQTGNFRHGSYETGDSGIARDRYSSAPVGQQSAAVANGEATTVGSSGGSVSVSAVETDGSGGVQVYRFGATSGPVRTDDAPGEVMPGSLFEERSAVTWGLDPFGGRPSGDVTLDYSGVSGVSAPVALVHRDTAGGAWEMASGWTQDTGAQTFSRSGIVPAGQYAVRSLPDRSTIYVDQSVASPGDGSSWEAAYASLQTALANATPASEIWIAEGVYVPGSSESESFTITGALDGIQLYGGFQGTESVRSEREPDRHVTVLSGDVGGDDAVTDAGVTATAGDISGTNSRHVLVMDGTSGGSVTTATTLDGLTVTGGQATAASQRSDASAAGGGLFCDGHGSGNACSPTLSNVRFAGNKAIFGGAVAVHVQDRGQTGIRILESEFTGNRATRYGGALWNFTRGNTSRLAGEIAASTFTGNTAGEAGGALYVDGRVSRDAPPSVMRIAQSAFVNNASAYNEFADRSGGGALFLRGGGLGETIVATSSVFADNGRNHVSVSEPLGSRIVGCTFTGATETAFVIGGTLQFGGTLTMQNVIAWGNASLLTDSGQDALAFESSLLQTSVDRGTNVTVADPLFADTADVDGEDGVLGTADDGLRVSVRSPAVDAGRDDYYPDYVDAGAAGEARVQDSDGDGTTVSNLGAYETTGPAAPIATTDAPADVGAGTVDFSGTVKPGGAEATVVFEYREKGANSFQTILADQSPLTGVGERSVTATLDGLSASTEYEVRLSASNDEGFGAGDLQAFTTRFLTYAITEGGQEGLVRTFEATPGGANQPVGVFRVTPAASGGALTGVELASGAPRATGVTRMRLWISEDDRFDVLDDTQLGAVDTDPEVGIPTTLTFDGFDRSLPGEARYLFLTADLAEDAEGTVRAKISSPDALALGGGPITQVNGRDTGTFSDLPLSGDASPLPVELTALNAQQKGEEIAVTWTTAAERNSASFRVQRRHPGGAATWTTVGQVEAAGTTTEPQSYRYTDTDLPYEADSLRYRLQQVDTDGATALSDPVTVERASVSELELLGTYPNPAQRQATIRFALPEGTDAATLRLYDTLGRRVRTVDLESKPGRHEATLDVAGLSSGVYFLRIRTAASVRTQRLTVVR